MCRSIRHRKLLNYEVFWRTVVSTPSLRQLDLFTVASVAAIYLPASSRVLTFLHELSMTVEVYSYWIDLCTSYIQLRSLQQLFASPYQTCMLFGFVALSLDSKGPFHNTTSKFFVIQFVAVVEMAITASKLCKNAQTLLMLVVEYCYSCPCRSIVALYLYWYILPWRPIMQSQMTFLLIQHSQTHLRTTLAASCMISYQVDILN